MTLAASFTISWASTLLSRKVTKRTRGADSRQKAEVATVPGMIVTNNKIVVVFVSLQRVLSKTRIVDARGS